MRPNWTDNAEYFNYENAIFISNPSVIKQYQKEFNNIWNAN
jgi:phosphatidylserine/phosphatidylglycerophosphate/cardiolipin synthase-like enzyme